MRGKAQFRTGSKYGNAPILKETDLTTQIVLSADGLLSMIKFGLERSDLLTEGGRKMDVKEVSFGNGGDTILVSFYSLYDRSPDIKGEMATIMAYLSGTFKGEIYPGFDIKFFCARAFNKNDEEKMYGICSKQAASTIAAGNSFEWLKSTIFQENTDDYRLTRAKTIISEIENGLRKVIVRIYEKMLGEHWWDVKIESKLNASIKTTYNNQFGANCSEGAILIQYAFTLDIKKIISADWGTFKHLFDGKTTFESTMLELNKIRREEAHNRRISEQHLIDLDTIYHSLLGKISNHFSDITVNYLIDNWRSKIKSLMIFTVGCSYTDFEFEQQDIFGRHKLLLEDTNGKIIFWGNVVVKLKSLNPPLSKKVLHHELVENLEELLEILELKLDRIEKLEFNDIEQVSSSLSRQLKKMDDFSKAFALSES